MQAFFNDQEIKDKKIPKWLSHLADRLFSRMSLEKAKTFKKLLIDSINFDSDFKKIKIKFYIYILEFVLKHFDHKKYPQILKCINDVIDLYKNRETDIEKFKRAAGAAYAAYSDATDADAVAYAVAYAAAEVAGAVAADAGAVAVAYAAHAIAYAADADADADATDDAADAGAVAIAYAAHAAGVATVAIAYATDAVYSADAAKIRIDCYDDFADKLIELVKDCK